MRFFQFILSFVFLLLPFATWAQSDLLNSQDTLSELNLLIAQYEARITKLQAENAVLRYEMAKAGISIPLTDLSGATLPIPTALPKNTVSSGTWVPASPTISTTTQSTLPEITTKYGKDVAGFISRINQDWAGIKSNYKFPSNARLAGYEFVQTGSLDYVFADIVVGTGTVGIYDIKILYQFEKSEYKRKLIWIFQYSATSWRYATTVGVNPFGWVSRQFVADPYYLGVAKPPVLSWTSSTSSGASAPVVAPSTPNTPSTSSVSLAEITKAYNEKRYLSTISLSNTYLETNTPTQDILNIRYRTYFIIGKYSESLAELAKIEKLGTLDKQTACNAQVIATYSKNSALVEKYTALCKK
jgi:hypothetical protein